MGASMLFVPASAPDKYRKALDSQAGALIDVLTTAPEVREVARRYLPWLVLMPVVGVASWMLDGIFIGATLTREMRNAMLPAVAIFAVAALTLPPLWGNHGLWVALGLLNIARAADLLSGKYPRRRPPSQAAAASAR